MQDHPMMRMMLKFRRNIVFNRPLDCIHILARRHTRSVAKAKNMRVHRLSGLT